MAEDSLQDQGGAHKRVKRLGLFAGLLIVVWFFLIYQFEADIVGAIPQSDLLLDKYVQLVDRLRAISDQWVATAIAWLEIQAEIVLGSTL